MQVEGGNEGSEKRGEEEGKEGKKVFRENVTGG